MGGPSVDSSTPKTVAPLQPYEFLSDSGGGAPFKRNVQSPVPVKVRQTPLRHQQHNKTNATQRLK
ncbi:hypothetical protein JZ751_028979 [Albula glossodonta]|uniref:Uncharacterized protein n=1 Tax=Albula glossodonta TaxID=121402 RepID=A0A8T2PG88_9TELE|nr:hypothetical protein JZ751_028979 [Albula glossodonta]